MCTWKRPPLVKRAASPNWIGTFNTTLCKIQISNGTLVTAKTGVSPTLFPAGTDCQSPLQTPATSTVAGRCVRRRSEELFSASCLIKQVARSEVPRCEGRGHVASLDKKIVRVRDTASCQRHNSCVFKPPDDGRRDHITVETFGHHFNQHSKHDAIDEYWRSMPKQRLVA